MVSKSLLSFILVGLVSGLIFGIYLLEVKNTSQLLFVEGPSISIVTEKFDFKKGEEIKIRIVNSGTEIIKFDDSSYGLAITGLSGILMYSPEKTNNISEGYSLEPGEEIEFVWNQIKSDGDDALEGLYKLSSTGFDASGNKIQKSTTITIWK